MQYDLKTIGESALVKLMWHGAPTRVLVHGEGVKRDVGTGDVIEVTLKQARELLSMSRLFTLDGDKPVKQASPLVIPEKTDEEGNKVVSLNVEAAEKLDTKKEVIEALKTLGVAFNDALSKKELKVLLIENLKEQEEAAAKAAAEAAEMGAGANDTTGNAPAGDQNVK